MSFSPARLLRAISVSVAVAALTAATVYIVSGLLFPVKGVRVTGNHVVSDGEVRAQIPDHSSLLTLNSGLLIRRLKTDPWIEGVKVIRNWRSGIVTVEVEERRAVLAANVSGRRIFVAQDGTRLPGSGGARLSPVNLDHYELGRVVENVRVLERNGVRVQEIGGVTPGGVHARVSGREVVFYGRVTTAQARALKEIMRRNPTAKVFDLRSPERVVVGSSGDAGRG
ncbi:cell division protein FtsQ/DivIB [Rubrobacter calidifluminis]|uniref:cell division protein FtsQ/DivIB n=1 Tax=Rubrobacter calidifluminis TaxID=1392640 RepID=UPI002360B1F6|nr:FtsQ-type POTRA domain-containing protein [Rubrobacter calidifluminis]